MQNEFKHSGDLGDIIWSLPTIRALGGGILYLDPKGGLDEKYVSWLDIGEYRCTTLNKARIDDIAPILEQQEYIDEVRYWEGNKVKYNLDKFRAKLKFKNLAHSHLKVFDLPFSETDAAWLQVEGNIMVQDKPVVISRSLKVQSNHIFWESLSKEVTDACVFLGTELEYHVFNTIFRYQVGYCKTSMLELFQIIKTCHKFLGNQSFPHTIAEGFKKDIVHESFHLCPAAIFERSGVENV